ncbi:MAG: ATP-binding protein [Myxococcota bacterium]|nr:ATP-binding protein [Myxococcota bacterium]
MQGTPSRREAVLAEREQVVAQRELALQSRERVVGEQEQVLTEREMIAELEEQAARSRTEAEHTRTDRERLLVQMRTANEKLILATLRADELSDDAELARVSSVESAQSAHDQLRRAEALTTQLLAVNEALRESETQFVTLANTIPMLAWYAQPDGAVAWFNQRWFQYTGTTFEGQAGWQWESSLHADDRTRVVDRWRASIASGEPWDDVFRLRRHDGELRWFLARALPLHDANGQIVRWFGTTVDIDDQKRAEADATASVRAKDEFLAMLGHELRNPLAPIRTALDLMTMRDPTKFERERTIIERQVGYLVRLVDDLLDVSRITGGKIELKREVVELADVVGLAVETATPLLEAKAHRLTINLGSDLLVDVDVVRMTQVISNLVTNAAKYTASQGALEIVGGRRGSRVWLAVRDNGIGISPAMLPLVFEMFAQEAQGSDRPAGGLGLGLAIVKNLLAMHGGTITAHSQGLGHGSQFEIELPESTRARDVSAVRRSVTGRGPTIVAHKVLIIDDNHDAGDLIAMSLAARGHDVRVALDAPSALLIVKDFIPEIVLTDIDLPVIDGYELAELLRASLAPHVVKFVAITGYGQPDDRQRTQDAGFALHLVKPVSIARLDQGIREVTRTGTEQPRR